MAINISSSVFPPLPPPPLECCHGVNKKLIVQTMKDVVRRRTVCERADDKAVVHRCLASVMSPQTYVLDRFYPAALNRVTSLNV